MPNKLSLHIDDRYELVATARRSRERLRREIEIRWHAPLSGYFARWKSQQQLIKIVTLHESDQQRMWNIAQGLWSDPNVEQEIQKHESLGEQNRSQIFNTRKKFFDPKMPFVSYLSELQYLLWSDDPAASARSFASALRFEHALPIDIGKPWQEEFLALTQDLYPWEWFSAAEDFAWREYSVVVRAADFWNPRRIDRWSFYPSSKARPTDS